jgi:hypothetical protein
VRPAAPAPAAGAPGAIPPTASRVIWPSAKPAGSAPTGAAPAAPAALTPTFQPGLGGISRPAARLVSPTVRLTAADIAKAASSQTKAPTITTRVMMPSPAKSAPAAAPAAPVPAVKPAAAPPVVKPAAPVAAEAPKSAPAPAAPSAVALAAAKPAAPVAAEAPKSAPAPAAPPAAEARPAAPAPAQPKAVDEKVVEVPSGLMPAAVDQALIGEAESYNVFLSQISSTEKREEAAKIICEIRKCKIEEARELVTRSMIPLLKDVSKAEAEKTLHRFRLIKVAGRMTLARKT